MKFCINCGESVLEQARFCRSCGTSLIPNPITSSQSANNNPPSFKKTFLNSDRTPKPTDRDITRTNMKAVLLSPQTADAISHTIFVVSADFAVEMQSICNSLGLNCAGILYDSNPSQIIKKCQDKLRNSTAGTIKYVCIIGNWNEVPPAEIQNTMLDDGDDFCLTDALYGSRQDFDCEDPFSAIPEIPVGRIPVSDREVVCRVITQSPDFSSRDNAFLFGVTADCWSEATHDIILSFPNLPPGAPHFLEPSTKDSIPRSAMLCSPVWDEKALGRTIGGKVQNPFQIILFNVHGGADDPEWVGEGKRYQYVRIFSPRTINNYNSALIVSEACYGGAIGYDEISIVEHFFLNGGNSFVGSSTIAYGSPSPPICAADLIAKHYIKGLYNKLTLGESLIQAKMVTISDDYMALEEGLKTILSFNLFGAPWQTLIRTSSQPPDSFQIRPPVTSSVLDRIRGDMSSSSQTNERSSLYDIRESYRRRLPERTRQFMIEKENLLKKIHEFQDFSKIEKTVKSWGGRLEDTSLNFIKAGEKEGYRLFCPSSTENNSNRILVLLLDNSGRINKTILSKGSL